MIYLTETSEIQDAIAYFSTAKTLWLDTEVADYNTKKPRLSLIQVLRDSTDMKGDRVTILDVLDRDESIAEFIEKIMVNPDIEKVFHSASYDIRLLGNKKVQNVTCTLELVKQIPYYLVPLDNYQLATLATELCHFPPVDKSLQGSDWGERPLSDRHLHYAKMDTVYVAQVHHRLLQLHQMVEVDPCTDNIDQLINRYRTIEQQWLKYDTEVKHLKSRLTAAMQAQNCAAQAGFALKQQQRTNTKINFKDLVRVSQGLGIEIDLVLTLTKAMQKELAEVIEQLPVIEETKTITQLRISDLDEDETIPF
ncbi:MAG: ribonuclease D [Jaaginema sp. PMC 1079.18]|nr:ribonuclease D [Jaaginema sp. PMC 1080.18]MEC4851563.1 ribonuclease D [Jaaginema sp. PMC 1079.18]MEC4868689.1 ribonuclease D [Jaaginema sp. PMC 1078.18]